MRYCSVMLDKTLHSIKKLIPVKIFNFFNPTYHWILSFLSALFYRFPSKKINIIAVTGTKGKSSTVEILNAILEQAGHRTALSNTIRYKIDNQSFPNLSKMSTPGRFFLQKILRKAVDSNCEYFILEMTSQGALLFRHRFIELDTLIFTNLTPEHIEAHGSYELYLNSKLAIAKNMVRSDKPVKTIIANKDDKESQLFLDCPANKKIRFSLKDIEPYNFTPEGADFTFNGKTVHTHLQGEFNLYNILGAITCAKNEQIAPADIISAIERITTIPGRLEKIQGPNFTVIVDYAHTSDSLRKIYEVFKSSPIIGVLGGTGGGRDSWKRSEMGKIADSYCKEIILTNEDPYDEDPEKIIQDVAKGITNHRPIIIIDRHKAISKAIEIARSGDVVIITGKGTDPYIMGPNDTKIPWSDSRIVKEIINKLTR